jgi:uncharacterized pyridoxamine 5'-phosphate oxidase family protein
MVKQGYESIWVVYHIGTGRTFFYSRRPLKKELKELCILNNIYIDQGEDVYDVVSVEKRMIES